MWPYVAVVLEELPKKQSRSRLLGSNATLTEEIVEVTSRF